MEANKFLDKSKDLFSCSWQARMIWALVESVDDEVNRSLNGE
jgi:hypothetical protein